jgi:hypothetical protein
MKKRGSKKTPLLKQTIKQLDLSTVTHSLTEFPWPYEDNSVEECSILHKLEYIPGSHRVRFMEELYRILTPGGKANFVVCYWNSVRAVQDPELQWPPLCEQSFLYFNKGWRAANNLPAIKCDFDFTYGYQVDPDTASRPQETQSFWIKYYTNAVHHVQLLLTKRSE